MLNIIEKFFERLIWESRLFILLAVVASIASSLILIFLGFYDVINVIKELFHFTHEDTFHTYQKDIITDIIGAIDLFLIATVLLIFGMGLYELFISKIDYAEKSTKASNILVIHSLDQLKEKIAKVVIMVLIITFFKYGLKFNYQTPLDILLLASGILLISIALYFTHAEKRKD